MIPPRTILAPVDFSEPSRTALAAAGRLARQTGAALIVVHAEHQLLAEAARQARIDLGADTNSELETFIGATPPAAGVSTRRHVAVGAPVDVITAAAQDTGADLIVIGSHGMSGPAHFVFGSTTEAVLRRSPVSVLVTPATWNPPQSAGAGLTGAGPLIAAIDFSPESTAAAKAACRLAAALGTTVTLVHVVAEMAVRERWQPHAEVVIRNRVQEARAQVESLAETLASPVPVSTRVETGDIPRALAAAAAPAGGTQPILVLGRKAPGQRDSAPGAIAYRVLMLAQVPVLVHVDGMSA
jgi:nucleotide-binding universal stress UspA family protein